MVTIIGRLFAHVEEDDGRICGGVQDTVYVRDCPSLPWRLHDVEAVAGRRYFEAIAVVLERERDCTVCFVEREHRGVVRRNGLLANRDAWRRVRESAGDVLPRTQVDNDLVVARGEPTGTARLE